MAKWFYYNASGEKIEVTGGQLKGLAKAGMITPDTIVETEEGKTAPARRVKGLTFVVRNDTAEPLPQVEPNPFTAVPPVNENPFSVPASLPVTETALEENNTAVSAPHKLTPSAIATYGVIALLLLYRFTGFLFLCVIVFLALFVVLMIAFRRHIGFGLTALCKTKAVRFVILWLVIWGVLMLGLNAYWTVQDWDREATRKHEDAMRKLKHDSELRSRLHEINMQHIRQALDAGSGTPRRGNDWDRR